MRTAVIKFNPTKCPSCEYFKEIDEKPWCEHPLYYEGYLNKEGVKCYLIPSESKEYSRSDWGNARRLVDSCGNVIRYCVQAKKWNVWDGTVWNWDDGEIRMQQYAKNTIYRMYEELTTITDPERKREFFAYILRCEQQSKLKCMIDSANNEPGIPININEFDTYKDLINVANGILDLQTSELYPHDPEKYFTKKISYPYNKDALCPQWLKFLNDIFEGDAAVINFIQRFFGYCLTGHTREQVFLIFWGLGSNGKGTFVDTIQIVMEDYYKTTDPSTIIQKKYERSSTNDLAELKGARLVTTSENDPHQLLDEGRIKRITGQDPIKCRFLYQEFFEYVPEYELILLTNHEPIIRAQDYSIWRRVLKVPFNVVFDDKKIDNNLRVKLAEEKVGIFKWLVEGAKKWYENGLEIPEKVKTATAEYKETLDIVGDFLADCCDVIKTGETIFSELYLSYSIWCKLNYHEPAKNKWFGRMIAERNFKRGKNSTGIRIISGLKIKKQLLENIRLCEGIEDDKTLSRTLLTSFRHFLESSLENPHDSGLYKNTSFNVPDNSNDVNVKKFERISGQLTNGDKPDEHIYKSFSNPNCQKCSECDTFSDQLEQGPAGSGKLCPGCLFKTQFVTVRAKRDIINFVEDTTGRTRTLKGGEIAVISRVNARPLIKRDIVVEIKMPEA